MVQTAASLVGLSALRTAAAAAAAAAAASWLCQLAFSSGHLPLPQEQNLPLPLCLFLFYDLQPISNNSAEQHTRHSNNSKIPDLQNPEFVKKKKKSELQLLDERSE